uniref:sensor histidine kinase n=1 Tax=Rhizobium sp. TaxID=391 RepID=UPI0028AB88F6
QILIKLLTNAINFAPEGSVVQLSCQRSEGDFLFSVADKGPGIPEDMLKSVFDRFETRGNGGRRTGVGLGLSIVESFVSLHHGTVSIDSRPGNGTIVTCRIPSATRPHSIAAE